ncbi:glycosyltransferase [Gelidibacter maritimus]|uniref:Glycosyltransferase n=1 Tax=Gelidibacter maritimus TaxID=2761487 RepID=A0A7W2M6H7_9FLAO|nr:glycosyltransferase [Gelidibacter maritimus]MBA6153575.1 glycosyltransferase [Gelidibacter maritimus]
MNSNKIKIIFVLPNLLPGGAERVFSYLAQNIDAKKFNATLLIMGYSKDASYKIENITTVFLEKPRVLNGIPALYQYIRKNKPNILVSAVGHLNTVTAYMSFMFPKTKFISREVTVLSLDESFFKTKKFDLLGFLSNRRFNSFDKIICQSQDMLDDIKNSYKVSEDKMIVINNPITDGFNLKNQIAINTPIQYITVGRLSREKGIDRILKILTKLNFPFHYTIIGDGVEKDNLFSLIDQYGLKDKITHINFTKDVAIYLSKSDFFLQGSYFEGFPNCLIESCAVGTPVIAFKAPGGTKEIIEDGINGFLVENEEHFLEKLTAQHKWDPIEVRESVYTKFNKNLILQQYEDLFLNILKQ